MWTASSAAYSPSLLKTLCGPTPWARPLPSRRAARLLPRLPTAIGEGLQAFCIPGSVADQRAVGLGHGNLGAMLLSEETKCFCLPGRP